MMQRTIASTELLSDPYMYTWRGTLLQPFECQAGGERMVDDGAPGMAGKRGRRARSLPGQL
jgi:hypothetical protein